MSRIYLVVFTILAITSSQEFDLWCPEQYEVFQNCNVTFPPTPSNSTKVLPENLCMDIKIDKSITRNCSVRGQWLHVEGNCNVCSQTEISRKFYDQLERIPDFDTDLMSQLIYFLKYEHEQIQPVDIYMLVKIISNHNFCEIDKAHTFDIFMNAVDSILDFDETFLLETLNKFDLPSLLDILSSCADNMLLRANETFSGPNLISRMGYYNSYSIRLEVFKDRIDVINATDEDDVKLSDGALCAIYVVNNDRLYTYVEYLVSAFYRNYVFVGGKKLDDDGVVVSFIETSVHNHVSSVYFKSNLGSKVWNYNTGSKEWIQDNVNCSTDTCKLEFLSKEFHVKLSMQNNDNTTTNTTTTTTDTSYSSDTNTTITTTRNVAAFSTTTITTPDTITTTPTTTAVGTTTSAETTTTPTTTAVGSTTSAETTTTPTTTAVTTTTSAETSTTPTTTAVSTTTSAETTTTTAVSTATSAETTTTPTTTAARTTASAETATTPTTTADSTTTSAETTTTPSTTAVTTTTSTETTNTTTTAFPNRFVYCPAESLTAGSDVLELLETPAGAWALADNKVCIYNNYPFRLKCLNNGTWEKQPDDLRCESYSGDITDSLFKNSKEPSNMSLELVKNISWWRRNDLTALDLYFVAEIFDKLDLKGSEMEFLILIESVNNLLKLDRKILNESQHLLNATDKILSVLDKNLVQTKNFSVDYSGIFAKSFEDLNVESFVGVMVMKDHSIVFLDSDTYMSQILGGALETAFVSNHSSPFKDFYVSLFQNDFLFNDMSDTALNSKILNILIPTDLPQGFEIEIYFPQSEDCELVKKCVHWNFGYDENFTAQLGKWDYDTEASDMGSGIFKCKFNHTTHFSMLLPGSIPDSLLLNILTYFGIALSIIGIFVILLTGLLFKQWRQNSNKKIILNISISSLLLIVFLIGSDKVPRGKGCVAIGAALHYVVLANLFWTLTVCYSNYRRFILEIHFQIENVILKYSVFSWCSPLVFVVADLTLDQNTYNKTCDSTNCLCFPKKGYYWYTVFIPICLIVTANCLIYILIIKILVGEKFCKLQKHCDPRKSRAMIVKSMFCMFFLMGLPWVLGFLGAIAESTVHFSLFSYLFSFSLACQGLIIFVFYIFDSKDTKNMWRRKFAYFLKIKQNSRKEEELKTTVFDDSSSN